MKPAPFEYERPESLGEALHLLARHGDEGKILAGGQSLIPVMNFRLAQPAVLIDVNRLGELDFVRAGDDGGLRIGALVRQARLEREALVAERAPLLAEAVPWVAHPQIRNRGTVGGSIAHADPAAELPAVMVALDARFRLARESGERWVSAAEFFGGLFATALAPEELLVEIALPAWPARHGACFSEVARRHGDYAMAGVAAVVACGEDGAARPGAPRLHERRRRADRRRGRAGQTEGELASEEPSPPSPRPPPPSSSRRATSTPPPSTGATWPACWRAARSRGGAPRGRGGGGARAGGAATRARGRRASRSTARLPRAEASSRGCCSPTSCATTSA